MRRVAVSATESALIRSRSAVLHTRGHAWRQAHSAAVGSRTVRLGPEEVAAPDGHFGLVVFGVEAGVAPAHVDDEGWEILWGVFG